MGSSETSTRQVSLRALPHRPLRGRVIASPRWKRTFRERAYFNRRLKAEQFLARREAEIQAFKAEQERLKFEAERKRVEDALVKEVEDREKAEAEQKRREDEARRR